MPSLPSWISATVAEIDMSTDGFRPYRVVLPGTDGHEVVLPLVVIRNGSGPAVLLTGGTHGDEFEGQIAVADLLRDTLPSAVSGLILALPLHNFPACLAGRRTGPDDGVDLNRMFAVTKRPPGPSADIADFIETRLVPPVDWIVDIHSGGKAHEFVLSANVQARPGSAEYDEMLPALLAFDAPYGLVFDEVGLSDMPHTGTLEGLARKLGKRAISSEFGGAGRATPASLDVARRGLRNILFHIGVRQDTNATTARQSRSELIALRRPEHYVPAPATGRFVPSCWLSQSVVEGQTLGYIYPLEDPLAESLPIKARSDGIVAAVASVGVQTEGAAVYFIAERLSRPSASRID